MITRIGLLDLSGKLILSYLLTPYVKLMLPNKMLYFGGDWEAE